MLEEQEAREILLQKSLYLREFIHVMFLSQNIALNQVRDLTSEETAETKTFGLRYKELRTGIIEKIGDLTTYKSTVESCAAYKPVQHLIDEIPEDNRSLILEVIILAGYELENYQDVPLIARHLSDLYKPELDKPNQKDEDLKAFTFLLRSGVYLRNLPEGKIPFLVEMALIASEIPKDKWPDYLQDLG